MSKHHKNYDKTANEIAEIAGGLQSGENTVKETEVFAEEFTEGFDLEAMEEIEEAAEETEAETEEIEEASEETEAEEIEEAAKETETEAEEIEEAAEKTEMEAEEIEEAAEKIEAEVEEVEEAAEETETEAEEIEEAAEETETEAEEIEEAAEEIEVEAEEVEEAAEETEMEAEEVEEAAEETEAAAEEIEEVAEGTEAEAEEVEEAAEEIEAEAEEVEEAAEEVEDEAEEIEEAAEEVEAEAEEIEEAAEEVEDEAEEIEEAAEKVEAEAEEIEEAAEEVEAEAEEIEEAAEEVEDEAEEIEEATEEEEIEEVDEDDYLDYDEDEPRQKKIVSGKTAVFTMLLTGLCTIALIAGAFIFATTFKKDIGLSMVSYTDKFNGCNTNDFTYAPMLGLENVSYSDAEMMLTPADVKALSSGKTVTKFDGMVNLQAKVRFGKIVTMDITFDPAVDENESASAFYMVLVGNVLSGFYPEQIANSDECFMLAYTIITYASPDASLPENVYRYQIGDVGIYMDHSKVMESGKVSDLSYHIENVDPHYLDTSTIDVSWLPWNKVKEEQPEDDVVYVSDADDTPEVSGSDTAE